MHWGETRHESANNTLTTKWETDLSMSLLLVGRCKITKQGFFIIYYTPISKNNMTLIETLMINLTINNDKIFSMCRS